MAESTDSSLVLSVRSVEYIDLDIPARWGGEQIEVSREFVVDIRERRLSRSRTLIMTGLLIAAAVAGSTVAITGFGADLGSDRPGGDPGNQM